MDQIISFSIFKKPPQLPFLLVIITSFSFFSETSQSISWNSTSCAPHNCGNGVLIEYPFWIPGLQEPSCGLLEFKTTCKDEYPILKLSGDDYIIKSYTNNSVRLVQYDLFHPDNNCPLPRHNFYIEEKGAPFKYDPDTTDLHFYYKCSSVPEVDDKIKRYNISCINNIDDNASFYTKELLLENYIDGNCQEAPINLPVTYNIQGLLENYTDVLKVGFVLWWDIGVVECEYCSRSGGHCGSVDNGDFSCFCKDGDVGRNSCGQGRGANVRLKIRIGFGAAGGTAIVLCLIFFVYLRNRKKSKTEPVSISRYSSSYPTSSATGHEDSRILFGVHFFTYDDLEKATDKFDQKNILGDGGFGTVYKGKLEDGRYIAVKRMYENNLRMVEQFMNEVEMLTRLHHRNLVTLYGCTSRHSRELLLVYEYVSNGTVADHLHGPLARPGSLPWITRMSIATETASALTFLHASDVIHRDVKTNNILLDHNCCVKMADFGLSRLFPTHVTHISTAPQGTPGYVDPEYHQCYHLTDKSDVYSFGVVLIELISSKPAVDISRHSHEINLSNMALNKIQKDSLHELVDPELGYESDKKVKTMIDGVAELAFQCLQSQRVMRPSMEEVFKALLDLQSNDFSSLKVEEKLKSKHKSYSPDTVMIDQLELLVQVAN